ncbi:AarF/ABC1/UbiB kinase family protein [Geobacter sp. SVR]|uniref:ABC1 kinase family protein n=1 Tax=Geobacter sp. SVR TaxID=2495594 RepID=UPI00143EFDB2|nr:AarF/UbiB family protein [Geobacter sp. SVR]BCS53087.1 ubiquinone biosynthesis protein UbiB [Geobacter sp. SVR]GCF84472.1 ubiquinone biosynthesis protein UbiB [Geobacter sp. SVR]
MFSFLKLPGNLRSIRRYVNIVRVLSSYGFDHFLEMLGLADLAARSRRLFQRERAAIRRLSAAERMRLALEELGPTFIKLGQILSTRPDVLPPAFISEFEKLQDNVPSFSFEEAKKQIENELGGPVGDFFSSIEPTALAAASIAQVHRATLKTGEAVVVKVRRPGVLELVESDISALMGLAHLAERHIPNSEVYDPVGIVREFSRTIRREMDFSREGHTIEKFRDNLAAADGLYFPRIYWAQTARGVLTLEYVEGLKVSDLSALDCGGYDRKLIARRGADAFLEMVLNHGFFHGDPHPGNVLIMPGNVVCLLDYGIVGRLDDELRNFLSDMLFAIVQRDIDEVVSLLFFAGDIPDTLNMRALKHDLLNFIDGYYEIPLQEIEVGRMLMEFIEIISLNRIRIQPDFMLLAKSLVVVEGMGRNLDPEFNMIDHLRPFMEKARLQKYSAKRITKDVNALLLSYLNLARNLPRDLQEIVNRINRNKFKIDLEHRGLDRFTTDFDRSVNRLSSSLILAALIIGSSIIMQTDKGPQLLGFPMWAFLGYTAAAVIGLWLVYGIIRSGRL